MNNRQEGMSEYRVGLGTDIHRLQPGKGFPLGGVFIPSDYATVAVSDGDVVLHALVDAVLGACGLGDIGDHFPESGVARGQDSRLFVETVVGLAADCGASLMNVDCIVDLEAVRLGKWKREIRDSICRLLRLSPSCVNVKAKTAEGLGAVGERRAVAAQVIVLARLDSAMGGADTLTEKA